MPRYYFHLKYGHQVIQDAHGDEIEDDRMALDRAAETAKALLRGAPGDVETWRNCVIEVTHDERVLSRTPVLEALEPAGDR